MHTNTKAIYGVVTRSSKTDNARSWWTRIGTAFVNRDGSLNLRFDFLPADFPSTTVQIREIEAKEPGEVAGPLG
jgi:hypothetical protein